MGRNIVISYDLSKPARNYDALIDEIKELGNWAHVQGSVWYLNSDLSAEQTRDRLLPYIDDDDSLFVVDATNNEAAWHNLKPEVARFIRENWAIKRAA